MTPRDLSTLQYHVTQQERTIRGGSLFTSASIPGILSYSLVNVCVHHSEQLMMSFASMVSLACPSCSTCYLQALHHSAPLSYTQDAVIAASTVLPPHRKQCHCHRHSNTVQWWWYTQSLWCNCQSWKHVDEEASLESVLVAIQSFPLFTFRSPHLFTGTELVQLELPF